MQYAQSEHISMKNPSQVSTIRAKLMRSLCTIRAKCSSQGMGVGTIRVNSSYRQRFRAIRTSFTQTNTCTIRARCSSHGLSKIRLVSENVQI